MIHFFRQLRHNLLRENRLTKYLIYAIGEIVLVVIGILIALQINNNNELRKTRVRELTYLQNIQADLRRSVLEIDEYIQIRSKQVDAASRIIEHFEGKPVDDWHAFNRDAISIYAWSRFYIVDNSFQELMNSGNLAMISNDSIKNGLLNLDIRNKKLKFNEDHFRYDTELTLYETSYTTHDIHTMVKDYAYQQSNGTTGEKGDLGPGTFGNMLSDIQQKNGFAFAIMEFGGMISSFKGMKAECETLIALIDKELEVN